MDRAKVRNGTSSDSRFGTRTRRALAAAAAVLASVSGAQRATAQDIAPYEHLDSVEGAWVNLNLPPVRPMMLRTAPGGPTTVYAVNTHDSTVEVFGPDTGPCEQAIYRVPWGPVSIAGWDDASGGLQEILVVCRGTYALVGLDPGTGEITRLLAPSAPGSGGRLLSEPGDLLVDQDRDRAFVSCSGSDAVAEIDLTSFSIARVYRDVGKSPLFLSFDRIDPAHPDDPRKVLVAPLLSGNNTTAISESNFLVAKDRVLDLNGQPQGLPDEDLYRLDPASGTVSAVAKRMGTILFAQGINPFTFKLWQLNTDGLNADPSKQTEAAVSGIFATNRLSIASLDVVPAVPTKITQLSGSAIASSSAVGQPYGLAFASTGVGFVAGLLTDNVTVITVQGNRYGSWRLPPGSIPRAVALAKATPGAPAENRAYVYCWGTNQIHVYDTVLATAVLPSEPAAAASPLASFSLGYDPTPADVRAGRALFYSARFSRYGDLACATCHVEGKTDLLVWNLSGPPFDSKGPMLTQTLFALEKSGRLHWRGERTLRDFLPAFEGLLGATRPSGGNVLTDEEFAQFEAFLNSLQPPANPNQHPRRILSDAFKPRSMVGSAVQGQLNWSHPDTVVDNDVPGSGRSCMDCHKLPVGSVHDIFPDVKNNDGQSKKTQFDVAHFTELWRRDDQLSVPILFDDPLTPQVVNVPSTRPVLGAALSHSGLALHARDFVDGIEVPNDALEIRDNLAAFLFQFDQGLAPVVHGGLLLDSSSTSQVRAQIQNVLLAQTRLPLAGQPQIRNVSVAVLGKAHVDGAGGPLAPVRWFWDPNMDVPTTPIQDVPAFRSEDPVLHGNRSLAEFFAQVNGTLHTDERNVFLGLPAGMAERFAVDFDLDGIFNGAESGPGCPPPALVPSNVDGSAPSILPSPRILWWTARVARLLFETSTPSRYEITLSTSDVNQTIPDVHLASSVYSKVHSVLLTGLAPSSPGNPHAYAIQLNAIGRGGGATPTTIQNAFVTNEFSTGPDVLLQHVVYGLTWGSFTPQGGALDATVNFELRPKRSDFPLVGVASRLLVARVLVNDVPRTDFAPTDSSTSMADAISFTGPPSDPLPQPDPLVVKSIESYPNPPPPSAFLISALTPATGGGHLSFRIPSGLVPGDRISVVVEAVFKVPGAQAAAVPALLLTATQCATTNSSPCMPLLLPLSPKVLSQWSFPDTRDGDPDRPGTPDADGARSLTRIF